jgi:hypothetical protein
MTQPPYTVEWILPFVREAVKGAHSFDYRWFVEALWSRLEIVQVQGVEKWGANEPGHVLRFKWSQAPPDLRFATNEAFFYLVRKGYIVAKVPEGSYQNAPNPHTYDVTPGGREWSDGTEPLPEDVAGYMKFLHNRVPTMDAVIEQYVAEAVRAFNAGLDFSAVVMLGAASEKALYLLADAMVEALKHQTDKKKLSDLLQARSLNQLLTFIRDRLDHNRKVPNIPYDGALTQLLSLFDAVRTQRNDAVHPAAGQVSGDSVRLLTATFPYALSKCEEIRAWLMQNPQSLA